MLAEGMNYKYVIVKFFVIFVRLFTCSYSCLKSSTRNYPYIQCTPQVNTNGVLSFGEPYAVSSSGGLNFSSIITPPIIAPFWDDINTNIGGAIYYRQDTNPAIHEQLRQKVSAEYPEVTRFIPSLVFVATWYRVEANDINFSLLHNTFQVVVISDGTLTFVCFNYDDLQWGGSNTLIGVSAGDGVNSLTGLGSLSEYVVFNQFSYLTYRIDSKLLLLL